MKPVDFKESNMVFAAPAGMSLEECGDLHVARNPLDGLSVSCWELEEGDLERLRKTGKVWLWVWGKGHPPVSVSTEDPFELEKSDTPAEGTKVASEGPKKGKCSVCGRVGISQIGDMFEQCAYCGSSAWV